MVYSIRSRIGLSYILLFLAVMFGLTVFIINFVEKTTLEDLRTQLENEAQLIAVSAAPLFAETDPASQMDELVRNLSSQIPSRITIIDDSGVVVGESLENRQNMENHSDRPEIIQARLTGKGSAIRFSETIGYEMYYVAVPITSGAEIIGYSRVALSLQSVQERVAYLRNGLIGASMLAAVLAGLLAVWISNKITGPLRNLFIAANQLASGKLESRLIPTTLDEIGRLTQSFNEMADQLSTKIKDLDAERDRIGAVLSVMSDGVIIVNSENQIELMNPSAQIMFAQDSQDVKGKSLFEIVRHHQVEEILDQCRKMGVSQTITLEIIAPKMYLQVTATPLGPAQPGNTLLLLQNLTRIRRLETVRQDFISNISHELRTPLAALKAIVETLQEGALDDPPAAGRFLQRMETELDALSQMVEELLELSRIESGRVPLKLESIQPGDLIQQAVQRLSLQAERAGLSVETHVAWNLPLVKADPSRMVQVIVNLLHNAIKFTPPGGFIRISAESQKHTVLFSIQDSGVGIPQGDLPRIFERFYKTDRARSSGGTGLGLAISRHLIEAHGGAIWAESKEQSGSTFFFTLPAAD